MDRYSLRRLELRNGWTTSADDFRAIGRRPRFSDGSVVRASILARLLGLRLLRLQAEVVVLPASPVLPTGVAATSDLNEADALLRRAARMLP